MKTQTKGAEAAPQKEKTESPWREIKTAKARASFQEILRLLVDYDEKSGRLREYGEPELHYLRRSIAVADPARLRIFLRDLGGFVYCVVAELTAMPCLCATTWVHEDGIASERVEYAQNPRHPVHEITCTTDLWTQSCAVVDFEESASAPGELAISLMLEDLDLVK